MEICFTVKLYHFNSSRKSAPNQNFRCSPEWKMVLLTFTPQKLGTSLQTATYARMGACTSAFDMCGRDIENFIDYQGFLEFTRYWYVFVPCKKCCRFCIMVFLFHFGKDCLSPDLFFFFAYSMCLIQVQEGFRWKNISTALLRLLVCCPMPLVSYMASDRLIPVSGIFILLKWCYVGGFDGPYALQRITRTMSFFICW